MTRILIINMARFFLLILLQVLLFNNIEFRSFIIPQVYVLFILLLPIETPKWLLMPLAFLLGLSVDFFLYIPGLHAAACTFMAFLRPGVYSLITSRQDYEPGLSPSIRDFGFRWFISYTVILVSGHHLVIYALDEFRFGWITLVHVALNVLLTALTVVLSQLFVYRPKKK